MSDSAPERLQLQSVLESPHAQREGNIVSLKPVGLPAYNPRDTDPRSAPKEHLPPIHRIPYETLLHIIHIYAHDSNYPVRDLSTLTLVCQHWRAIVEDASSLWGRIDASEGLVAVRKGLQMTKDAALHITYIRKRSKTDQSAFFNTIGERIGQWRSLVADAYTYSDEDSWAILQTTIPPTLEKLHLSGDYLYWDVFSSYHPAVILFGGAAAPPGLKDVRLTMIPIAVTELKLACLKSLHLDSIQDLSTSELLRILGHSPALETLALTCMPHLDNTALNLPPGWTIQLPSLSHISLVYIPVPFTNLVLSVLEAPCLQKLRIGSGNAVEGFPSSQLLDEVLVHLVPTLKSLASTASAIGVTVMPESEYKIVVGGLEIEVDGVDNALLHFQDSFKWLCKHLGGNLNSLPFHLRIDTCESSLAYLEWFTSRVVVTELSLWCSRTWNFEKRTGEEVLLLSHPIPSSSASWFLPDTEVLISNLVWECSNPEILEMIKRRHSANREHGEGGSGVPKKFKEIRLSCGKDSVRKPLGPSVDLEFLKAVETAGEGADVYWEGKKWTSAGLGQ